VPDLCVGSIFSFRPVTGLKLAAAARHVPTWGHLDDAYVGRCHCVTCNFLKLCMQIFSSAHEQEMLNNCSKL